MSGRKAVRAKRAARVRKVEAAASAGFSAVRIAARVAALGRAITRAYQGRTLDLVVTLDRAFVFGADLMRKIDVPMVCHFVSADVRDVEQGGQRRREVFFGARPELKGRDVLLVDAVLESGVTQEFLLRRLGDTQPRSLRLAVLLDKPGRRRVSLEPDYFGFRTASNSLWIGYGLASANGTGRNGRSLLAEPHARKRQGKSVY